jgi:hypothetical protein
MTWSLFLLQIITPLQRTIKNCGDKKTAIGETTVLQSIQPSTAESPLDAVLRAIYPTPPPLLLQPYRNKRITSKNPFSPGPNKELTARVASSAPWLWTLWELSQRNC